MESGKNGKKKTTPNRKRNLIMKQRAKKKEKRKQERAKEKAKGKRMRHIPDTKTK